MLYTMSLLLIKHPNTMIAITLFLFLFSILWQIYFKWHVSSGGIMTLHFVLICELPRLLGINSGLFFFCYLCEFQSCPSPTLQTPNSTLLFNLLLVERKRRIYALTKRCGQDLNSARRLHTENCCVNYTAICQINER